MKHLPSTASIVKEESLSESSKLFVETNVCNSISFKTKNNEGDERAMKTLNIGMISGNTHTRRLSPREGDRR
ncbi:hypothetical protein GCM10026983_28330 [Gracilibacillus alcaliphilus]